MANTVRILRSTTAGAVPASLVSGQIAINENDGRLYYRSAAGVVTQFSAGATSVVEYATTASFPGTGSSAVLYLATDTRRLYSWTGSVYAEVGAVSSYDSRWDLFLPPAPTGVSGPAASGQVALTWTAPTVLSQTPITDYVVQYSSNGGSTWTTFSDGTSASASATVTGLTNGTAYTFRVAAVNAIGTGAYSSASAAVTPSAFTPNNINGLALWLDAADANTLFDATSGGSLVAADGSVARWQDKSGNARHATQGTASRRPTRKASVQGGRDALRFDGNATAANADAMLIPGSEATFNFLHQGNATVFCALINGTKANYNTIMTWLDSSGLGAGQGYLLTYDDRSSISANDCVVAGAGSGASTYVTRTTNNFVAMQTAAVYTNKIQSTAAASSRSLIYKNGTLDAAINSATGASTGGDATWPFSIGGAGNEAGNFTFQGDFLEIIIYNSALSDANRALVENYLIAKWGIT